MKKRFLVPIIIIFIFFIIIIGVILFYINGLNATSNQSEEVSITIDTGSTSASIGQVLKQKDLIKNELVFKLYTKFNNITDMKAGDYILNKTMGVKQIIDTLIEGPDSKQTTIDITFLEGKNIRWIANKIALSTNNSADDVYNKLEDKEYIKSLIEKYWFLTEDVLNKDIYYPLEGYLFPDTYNFKNKDVSVETIFETMLDEMETKLEKYKAKIQSSGVSVHRLLTIASVVELEASREEDRAGVASVFYNRIEKGMTLGSDVTTYYAVKVDVSERDLKKSELNLDNPYNTRGPNMAGKLPIGPIASVGLASIEAALQPEQNDYLFFVADKNGKVYYAKTSEEHNKNIKNLQQQGLWYTYE